ncbi:hypothetical protein ELI41_29575 (plasmid) [Rhizobium leguminosarum]|uniref:hypothetical protein n=1 Tax=Rhizobium leguminosarum TaxID=384 RepID=UPI0010325C89|nr:hypothetical protein [Rhizobium leguminosarum]TAU80459.1 hypothetical protein ELI41_29575 [Rhizobium leguminosarum]
MIRVDIHTREILADTRIYVARPGPNYKFYELFVDRNFVGPDLPGLDLPAFDRLAEVEDFMERVKRSVAIRRYAVRGERDIPVPAADLADYVDAPTSRSIAQFARVARAYFSTMKAGDLIIVPPANFRGLAHIGELTGPPNQIKATYPNLYPGTPLQGRNVAWRAVLEKAKLPAQALDALQKPSALFLLTREAWPAIFRRAYGSYSMPGEYGARFEITSEKFQTTDDFLIQAFFNFVSKNTELVQAGSDDLLSLRDGAFAAGGAAPDLYTNVNSPGGLSLKSLIVTPIVIAVMLTLAISVGVEAYAAAEAGTLVFGNSQAPAGDQCTVEVSNQVVTQLRLLGYDRWSEACEVARSAAEKTGISTTVAVGN